MVGAGAMPTLASNCVIKLKKTRRAWAGIYRYRTLWHTIIEMDGPDSICLFPFQHCADLFCRAECFLTRFKYQDNSSREFLNMTTEDLCYSQEHRHMSIMPTSVAPPWNL